jgi:hypothetical protein
MASRSVSGKLGSWFWYLPAIRNFRKLDGAVKASPLALKSNTALFPTKAGRGYEHNGSASNQ